MEGGRCRRTGAADRSRAVLLGGADARSSVERLDNHVSTLHQDVATLSQEVRRAAELNRTLSTAHTERLRTAG